MTNKVNPTTSIEGRNLEAAMKNSSMEKLVLVQALRSRNRDLLACIRRAHKALELGRPTQAEEILKKTMEDQP